MISPMMFDDRLSSEKILLYNMCKLVSSLRANDINVEIFRKMLILQNSLLMN